MKRNLTLFSLFIVLLASKITAQTYRAINVTGFTHDVIAEGNPAAGTTSSVTIDATGYVLYSALYTGTVTNSGGLNNSRVYTTSSRTYTLAPYAGKNTVRIPSNASDSLIVTNPSSYSVLSLLGFSSGIDAVTDITVRFTDGSSAVYNSRTLFNWSSSQPAMIAGFGKTNRATNAIYYTPTEPKMFSIDLPIACSDQGKNVSRIVVKNATTGATVYLFAVSAVGKSSFLIGSKPVTCKGTATGTGKALGVDPYGPFTYSWMPGMQTTQTVTDLAVGNHTLTVTDGNGCVYTNTVAITEPVTSFSITSISSSSLTCGSVATGSAQVSVTGGNSPYVYTWNSLTPTTTTLTSNSISALTDGNYSVSVRDNNGCTLTATTAVTKPNVVISVGTTSLLCGTTANGSATVTSVTGATGPFTYTWMPSGQTASVTTGLGAGTYTVMVKDGANCVNSETLSITAPAISLTTSQATCTLATGSATVSGVSGGAGAPYTYTWSPSGGNASTASALSAGNYTVTVRDNANCPVSKTFTLTALNPTLTVVSSSLACGSLANGSATVTAVTGASGPYTYSWMPSSQTSSVATGLGSGTYSVTVRGASGCVATETITIAKPVVSVATTSNSCRGLIPTGGATVTAVNGGVSPYTYSWDSGTMPNIANGSSLNGVNEGSYVINVTDANNCVTSTSFTIAGTIAAGISAVTTASAATCSGINNGKASITVNNGLQPYTYYWNTTPPQYTSTVTNLPSPNTFVATVIDFNGCLINRSVVIYPAPTEIAIYASPSNTICLGNPVGLSITGLTGTGTHTWSTGATTTSINVTPTASLTTYTVTGRTTSGCFVTGSTSIITSTSSTQGCAPVGIDEQAGSAFNLYPNPNNGEFTIVFEQMHEHAVIEVVDALGKLVLTQPINGLETMVNSNSLQNGIYFVTVKNESKIIMRTKVIKQ